ncbi:Uncharacterized protein dnm_067310 [Desulfonema magnum]|uniref:Uncharacterized protein n=1 Tax=Desulfonema magnum TaxID=45655 RepID=A0A975BT09_9BACT|nr:Uncharacterized protein dnm_067310 [Desulfonema magnum]
MVLIRQKQLSGAVRSRNQQAIQHTFAFSRETDLPDPATGILYKKRIYTKKIFLSFSYEFLFLYKIPVAKGRN